MLVLRPIGSEQARYYLEGPAPGRWMGGGAENLGLGGPVVDPALHALLAGHQPDGAPLLARIPRNRRSGFDLIVAAPKSVSLLAALGDPPASDLFSRAHEQAVRSTIGYLERNAAWTRRRDARIATSGFVAAAFTHGQSGAGDPHLHSHVVVANLVQGADGRWSALDSRSLFRHSRAAGALYQATLRHHLAEQGLAFTWTVRPSGLGDVRGVPRTAIEAGSLRHRQVVEQLASGLADGARTRAVVAGVTRGEQGGAVEEPWRQRVAGAGFDRAAAADVIAQAARGWARQPAVAPDDRVLAAHLASQHSRFQRADAVRAVAVLATQGAPADQLEAIADRFLRTAVAMEPGVWTTAHLRQLEDRIVAIAASPDGVRPGVGLVRPTVPPPVGLSQPAQRAVDRLTRGGASVDLLAGGFLGQAEVLDAARAGWEASGHRVTLVTRTTRAQQRWLAVAGLDGPVIPGAHGPAAAGTDRRPTPTTPSKASVVVVDAADRWSTADLHRVMADAAARRAKLVLLDGGSETRRRQPESPAIAALRGAVAVIDAGGSGAAAPAFDAAAVVVAAGRGAAVTVAPSGTVAIDRIVADWSRLRAAGDPARMVALGRDEVEVLNTRARAVLAGAGRLHGPTLEIGGRPFQAGDEVVALRPDRRLGLASGAVGQVSSVDPQRQQMSIRWAGRDDPVPAGATRAPPVVAHAYATTPAYLRHGHVGSLLSLGAVERLAPGLRPDRVFVVTPVPADRTPESPTPVAALLTEVAGPRPALTGPPAGVNRPLAELTAERDRLADHLLAAAPVDPRPELRRLDEDRAWLVTVPERPGSAAVLASVDSHQAELTEALGHRATWLEAHRETLLQWGHFSQAIAWREAALGFGAEVRPTAAVVAQLGPPPGGSGQAAWRRAAQAIEVHRDRLELPDQPLELPSRVPALSPELGAGRALSPGGR